MTDTTLAPVQGTIATFLDGACREDLVSLAYAGLRIAAELRAAQDWDGGGDWLDKIAQTTTVALANLTEPGTIPGNSDDPTDPDDSDAVKFAWRRWLGPDAEAWMGTYDPDAPETWEGTYEGWEAAVDRPRLLRETVDALPEADHTAVLLAMGMGPDDWHDADLSDGDREAEVIAALQQLRAH